MKTIQELILGVQDRISLPLDDDDRWSTTALVRAFNAALDDKLTPDLVAEGSNYLVHRDVIPLTVNGSVVYPLNSIPINKRAVGRALREVKFLPAGKTKIEDELNCPAISLEEKDMFSSESELYGSSVPYVFLENDSLRLVGGDLNGSIVMYYSLEPSFLLDPTTSVTPSVPVQYATVTDCQISVSLTATTTLNSNTLINPSINPTTLNIIAGMPISGKNIPSGATVVSVTASTIVISTNATATETGVTATIQKNQILATSAGTAWDTYQATGTTKFVDIYCKTTGAILKANVRVTRSSTSYVIAGLSQDEINQIKAYQPGGFPVSGPYESELLLLPAGRSEFSTIPYEFDQLLILLCVRTCS